MVLTNQQKEWIELAVTKGHTLLEIKKKLKETRYTDKVIDEMLDEYDKVKKKFTIEPTKEEIEEEKKEAIEFEGKVKTFINNEDSKELSWSEKRQIKKFLKNVTSYQTIMKKSIELVKKEIIKIKEKVKDEKHVAKEMEWLKRDIIERIIDSKEILDIEHPETGEEVTENNLKTLSLDQLILLMEENVDALQIIVNGKITE